MERIFSKTDLTSMPIYHNAPQAWWDWLCHGLEESQKEFEQSVRKKQTKEKLNRIESDLTK